MAASEKSPDLSGGHQVSFVEPGYCQCLPLIGAQRSFGSGCWVWRKQGFTVAGDRLPSSRQFRYTFKTSNRIQRLPVMIIS